MRPSSQSQPLRLDEEFCQQVWEMVKKIPYGHVATYGQIAAMIAPPRGMSTARYFVWGARMVGRAMAKAPQDVPWHRVINAQGKISPRDDNEVQEQGDLLSAEGIRFDEKGRIDLSVYSWKP